MRALIIEDDATTSATLEGLLQREGWETHVAEDLATAWTALCAGAVDVVLLDLSLPDGEGTDLLARIRRGEAGALPDPKTMVLVISSRSQLKTRLAALDQGADGYITKPVHLEEVAALVRAMVRRRAPAKGPLSHKDIVVDPVSRTVMRAGAAVEVADPEFCVLLALLQERPRALSRGDIQARTGNRVESTAVDVQVHHLRRKLGETVIQTVRGIGYRVPPDSRT
jgi:two-component system, OmpR family, response regulator QseB